MNRKEVTFMCPDCQEPLIVYELEGVEIDRCLSCGGTWLDSGELAMITEQAGVAPGRLTLALETAWEGSTTKRRCPRCRKKLRPINIGENPSVGLDRCPRGHGLWLDTGEMEAVITSFAEGEEGSVADFFSDLYKTEIGSERS
jgi:Zn-finger nucleic acid-binding protein